MCTRSCRLIWVLHKEANLPHQLGCKFREIPLDLDDTRTRPYKLYSVYLVLVTHLGKSVRLTL
ncbi:hypothetical protein Scep_019856 [Stephania cephalantha]|uniref:Uncharacterized protein n=1 Tax=Stephania cephalantha TaxID=152367 RepID=A0AAP0IC27_9MAGN